MYRDHIKPSMADTIYKKLVQTEDEGDARFTIAVADDRGEMARVAYLLWKEVKRMKQGKSEQAPEGAREETGEGEGSDGVQV